MKWNVTVLSEIYDVSLSSVVTVVSAFIIRLETRLPPNIGITLGCDLVLSLPTELHGLSVSLSVGLSPSEPCKNIWSDRDAIYIEDSGGPKEPPIRYSRALPAEYCIVGIPHNTAI